MRPGLTAGALGPSIVSLNMNKCPWSPPRGGARDVVGGGMVVSFFACFLACPLKITGAAQRFLFSVRDSGCHGNARSPAPVKVSVPPEMWEARTLRSARANGTRQPPPPPPPATGRLGGEEEEDLFVFNDTIEGLGMSGVVCECVYYCRT